jgi:hypothetical protein
MHVHASCADYPEGFEFTGIAAGDLIGVRGREGDVAFAQRWATVWLTTAVCCLGVSGLAGALTSSIYEDAARLSRLGLAAVLGVLYVVVLGCGVTLRS